MGLAGPQSDPSFFEYIIFTLPVLVSPQAK